MKAAEQYFHVVLFIMLYKVVLLSSTFRWCCLFVTILQKWNSRFFPLYWTYHSWEWKGKRDLIVNVVCTPVNSTTSSSSISFLPPVSVCQGVYSWSGRVCVYHVGAWETSIFFLPRVYKAKFITTVKTSLEVLIYLLNRTELKLRRKQRNKIANIYGCFDQISKPRHGQDFL